VHIPGRRVRRARELPPAVVGYVMWLSPWPSPTFLAQSQLIVRDGLGLVSRAFLPPSSTGPFGLISLMVRQQVESVVGPGQTCVLPCMMVAGCGSLFFLK
jgi:hypothetical protein